MDKYTRIISGKSIHIHIMMISVKGMSFEFVALNFTGFLFLSIYSTIGYLYPDQLKGSFEVQDLAFAYNAVLATIVTII